MVKIGSVGGSLMCGTLQDIQHRNKHIYLHSNGTKKLYISQIQVTLLAL